MIITETTGAGVLPSVFFLSRSSCLPCLFLSTAGMPLFPSLLSPECLLLSVIHFLSHVLRDCIQYIKFFKNMQSWNGKIFQNHAIFRSTAIRQSSDIRQTPSITDKAPASRPPSGRFSQTPKPSGGSAPTGPPARSARSRTSAD